MNDYLPNFEQYRDIKEIAELIDEVKKLRHLFQTHHYDAMYQHINSLTKKYLVETATWNFTHQSMPTTDQQAYLNAEAFLRLKGFSVLIQKGVSAQEQLSIDDKIFIESATNPQ